MGIQVEFNPDLALRNIYFFEQGQRKVEECVPEELEEGRVYPFLKRGQRNYYMLDDEPIPLLQTDGKSNLSRPLAAIRILEATHFNDGGEMWTRGLYEVLEVYDVDDVEIHFEGFLKVK